MAKRGYHHGDLKRALVDAALVLIEEKGPSGFTLSEAAKRAGVTPAAVYRHFEGRDDLIAEAARQGYEIFADVMQFAYDKGQPSALAAFEATGRAYLAFARKYPGHYIAMFESGISVNQTPELAAVANRASAVLERRSAYCVPKAVLLTAAARAAGIPARLGFADVRNHLQSERLEAVMQTDLFVFHGYSALWIDGRWVKASPAFNAELCARFGVAPLDFDGRIDALLHAFTGDGRRHMEYVRDRGLRQDLPLDEILTAFAQHYPGVVGPPED